MLKELFELLIESAEHSFTGVTAFVGTVLMLFSYINFLQAGGLVEKIKNSKKYQPIIGALLGLTPGCGGAIFVIPLFPRGIVSFGTIVATLIATTGDSSFILISKMPVTYLVISAISFVVAVITGYLVDGLPIGDKLLNEINLKKKLRGEKKSLDLEDIESCDPKLIGEDFQHIGHKEGDFMDQIIHEEIRGHEERGTLRYKITHSIHPLYWVLVGAGLIFGILEIFQVDIGHSHLHDISLFIGILGTILSITLTFAGNKFMQNHTHEETEIKLNSFRETIIHNAQETAFIGTWVFIAFFAYELSVMVLGGGSHAAGQSLMTSFLTQTGLASVVIGALIGAIPGCGPQIIFAALYTKGMLPFAAILANSISQDGDALFPLIALHKKSAFWSTIFNLIPGLIVGFIFYFLEFNILI